jgi:PilZ domain
VDNSLALIMTSDVTGLIARDVPVTLANISRGGCLLESACPVAAGTVGLLRVEIRGRVYTDTIRVTRCAIVPGAGERHHVGVEFLHLTVPGPQSLRLYAAVATEPPKGAGPLRFASN